MTAVFAVYPIALVVMLIVFARLPDRIGRRPVLALASSPRRSVRLRSCSRSRSRCSSSGESWPRWRSGRRCRRTAGARRARRHARSPARRACRDVCVFAGVRCCAVSERRARRRDLLAAHRAVRHPARSLRAGLASLALVPETRRASARGGAVPRLTPAARHAFVAAALTSGMCGGSLRCSSRFCRRSLRRSWASAVQRCKAPSRSSCSSSRARPDRRARSLRPICRAGRTDRTRSRWPRCWAPFRRARWRCSRWADRRGRRARARVLGRAEHRQPHRAGGRAGPLVGRASTRSPTCASAYGPGGRCADTHGSGCTPRSPPSRPEWWSRTRTRRRLAGCRTFRGLTRETVAFATAYQRP